MPLSEPLHNSPEDLKSELDVTLGVLNLAEGRLQSARPPAKAGQLRDLASWAPPADNRDPGREL